MSGIQYLAKSGTAALTGRAAILTMASLIMASLAMAGTARAEDPATAASAVAAHPAGTAGQDKPDGAQADNMRIPDPRFRECIFEQAGITPFVKDLDQLDRDFIFMRAARYSLEEFQARKTQTAPEIPYGKLIPGQNAGKLLELVKSSRRCGNLSSTR